VYFRCFFIVLPISFFSQNSTKVQMIHTNTKTINTNRRESRTHDQPYQSQSIIIQYQIDCELYVVEHGQGAAKEIVGSNNKDHSNLRKFLIIINDKI